MMSRQLVKQRELFEWLQSLDLSHYFEPFVQHGYQDLRICAEMGETDLEIIGVGDIHEKIEFLQAIRHLRLSHFGKEMLGSGSDGRQFLDYAHHHAQTQFPNGDGESDELKYCLQKRFLSSSNHGPEEGSPCKCSGDYQDIDECDCGPLYLDHHFYESLPSPRRHSQRNVPVVSGNERRRKVEPPLRKFTSQHHGPEEFLPVVEGTLLTKSQLRDHHPIRRPPVTSESSRPFGTTGPFNELTQENIDRYSRNGGQPHLYGSQLPQPTSSVRKVESEDLDSSSGIEQDLASRNYYDPRTTSASTNTESSSSTPEEILGHRWDRSGKKSKAGGSGSWYRGPPTFATNSLTKRDATKKSNFRNSTGNAEQIPYGLDVLQLQTVGQLLQINSSPKSNGNVSGQTRRVRSEGLSFPNCAVPTVCGLLSSIESNQFSLEGNSHRDQTTPRKAGKRNMASNLNCREFDYEDYPSDNTYEEINRIGPSNYITPTHHPYPHHQYLESVIVPAGNLRAAGQQHPTVNPPPGYENVLDPRGGAALGNASSPNKHNQIYTPGIYSPSSCLVDRDDIYDYAPPVRRNRHFPSSPAKACSSLRSKRKSKSKASLSCVSGLGLDSEGSGPGSPLKGESCPPDTVRYLRGGEAESILVTSNSTPTHVNFELSGGARNGYGSKEGGGGKVLSFPSSPSSQCSNGCRTLGNLSKLSRRLGLGRLFRTLRIHGHALEGSSRKGTVHTKPRLPTAPINATNRTSLQQDVRNEKNSQVESPNDKQGPGTYETMSSLPSNERIIDTINRLKYEELQKRKKRIAEEHQSDQPEGPSLRTPPPPPSPLLSPGRAGGSPRGLRSSNPMRSRKKNKSQTEGNGSGGLEEDSIQALADDFLQLPPTSGPGSSGTSPSKSLLSKVKELGAKNHKKLRRFSFSSKSLQSDHVTSDTRGVRRGSDIVVSPTKRSTAAIDIVGGSFKMVDRNSSEEDLNSLPSIHHRSLSICDIEEYDGPFVGKAIALVDCISSPYDLHALSYKKGDILKIIEKKPTGSWKGKLNNKIGYFKFINVQVLPEDDLEEDGEGDYGNSVPCPTSSLDSATFPYSTSNGNASHSRRKIKARPLTPGEMETRQTVANVINGIRKENAALLQLNSWRDQGEASLGPSAEELNDISEGPSHHPSHSGAYQKRGKSSGRRRSSSSLKKERPRSVGDLLRRINLEEHIPLFILHGFESLDLFKELEEEDLDRLEILDVADRAKILTAVELLRDYDATEEIPPIIIPAFSCPADGCENVGDEDSLNRILEPPPNFTRGGNAGAVSAVRDSGVFLKCDDKEEEDPEVDEIILSPANLQMSSLNPSDKFLLSNLRHKTTKQKPAVQHLPVDSTDSNMAQFTSLEEHYGEVRQRFLHAKSLFESCTNGTGVLPVQANAAKSAPSEYKNQFLYCEKSSDSGISLGANSPPPNNS